MVSRPLLNHISDSCHPDTWPRGQLNAQLIIGAGFATTDWKLSVTTLYILRNPSVLGHLPNELEEAVANTNESGPASVEMAYRRARLPNAGLR
jgi:hypothetical protein